MHDKQNGVLARLIIAGETSGSFRDFLEGDIFTITPMLDWQVSEDTNISFKFSYLHSNSVPDRGFFNSLGPVILDLPRDRFLGDPADNYRVNQYDWSILLTHQFNESLSGRLGFRGNIYQDDRDNVQQNSLLPDGKTITRSYSIVTGKAEYYNGFVDGVAKFETGFLEHELLGGVDFSIRSFPYKFRRKPYTNLNIFDPVYRGKHGFGGRNLRSLFVAKPFVRANGRFNPDQGVNPSSHRQHPESKPSHVP